MTTRREQIISSLTATLAATTGIGTVYRSRMEAFSRDEAPALIIEPSSNLPTQISTCKLDHRLSLAVVVYTRGADADQQAEPIIASAHALMMADRTVGGLAIDIMPGLTDWQRDRADLSCLWLVSNYEIRYRTAANSLESA